MSKSKIMAIVISAVVVVIGAGVAIGVLESRPEVVEEPTAAVSEVESTTSIEDPTVIEEIEVEETVTDAKGEAVTDKAGKVVTTIKTVTKVVKESATTKAKAAKTTDSDEDVGPDSEKHPDKEYKDTGVWYVDGLGRGLTSMEKEAVLGYSYNSDGDYFYTDDKDCWQKGFGYNEAYDQSTSFAVMFIDKLRIRFDYNGLAWMVELWKGQYGWTFVGAEIGIYTTADFKTSDLSDGQISHYNCADQNEWLKMSMDVYWDNDKDGNYDKIFSRPYTAYWWITGFKFGTLNRYTSPITEVIVKARMTFKSATQASLFTKGMKMAGFRGAGSSSGLSNDSIYQNGADVYFRWYSIHSKYITASGNDSILPTKAADNGDSGSKLPSITLPTITVPTTAEDNKPD